MISRQALYEQTAEWVASALHMVEKLMQSEDPDDIKEWKKWSVILRERTAFKHDVADAPPVDVQEVKHGKWEEKEVIHAEEARTAIEEWQSCRCSVCGRYDTRPYMYYFHEPNFCSWCGARMEDGDE